MKTAAERTAQMTGFARELRGELDRLERDEADDLAIIESLRSDIPEVDSPVSPTLIRDRAERWGQLHG